MRTISIFLSRSGAQTKASTSMFKNGLSLLGSIDQILGILLKKRRIGHFLINTFMFSTGYSH